MAEKTGIAWTHHTFNISWGCVKVSPGCKFCYADELAERVGWSVWGPSQPRRTFKDKHWQEPLKWQKAAEQAGARHKVFCSSMCDNFEDHPTIIAELAKLWPLIRATPNLDWQLLTKRADRIASSLPGDWGAGYPNVWLGVSIENNEWAWRADYLSRIPAVVRFVSYEPALGPLDLTKYFGYNPVHADDEYRRFCLSCGYQWGIGNRRTRPDLASRESEGWEKSQNDNRRAVQAETSGAPAAVRLSASEGDVRREAAQCSRSSAGISALQRQDSAGPTRQSQKLQSLGQSTKKPGASYGDREPDRQADIQSVRGEESSLQVVECPSCGHQNATVRRSNFAFDSQGVWRELPARFKDMQTAAPLINWSIYGGESGKNRRPEGTSNDPKCWARDMRQQCQRAGIAFFHKQSSAIRTEMGIELDGQIIREFPTPRGIQVTHVGAKPLTASDVRADDFGKQRVMF